MWPARATHRRGNVINYTLQMNIQIDCEQYRVFHVNCTLVIVKVLFMYTAKTKSEWVFFISYVNFYQRRSIVLGK